MTATMTRPTVIPFRWVGTRLDIRALLTDEGPLFAAEDICAALEFHVHTVVGDAGTVVARYYPAESVLVAGITDPGGSPTRFFTADTVRSLADERLQFDRDNGFLDWFEEQFFGRPLTDLADLAPREIPDTLRGPSYEVREAAAILSRDPALDYGQRTLFAALHDTVGWLEREQGIWVPTAAAVDAGYLIRHRVRIPGQKALYPQVRITPDGLTALHKALGGISDLVAPAPQIPLLEIQ